MKKGEGKQGVILAALRSRYLCEALPRGALTTMGNEFGVTRERVRQIAIANGFAPVNASMPATLRMVSGGQSHKTDRACGRCGKAMSMGAKGTFCYECRRVELPCTYCGKPKRVSAVILAHRVGKTTITPDGATATYTGRVFCNRICFGKWAGEQNRGKPKRKPVTV